MFVSINNFNGLFKGGNQPFVLQPSLTTSNSLTFKYNIGNSIVKVSTFNNITTTGICEVSLLNNYRIYKFTGNGKFKPSYTLDASSLLVAGGGSGGSHTINAPGGGGGAGAVGMGTLTFYSNSEYTITIGNGGYYTAGNIFNEFKDSNGSPSTIIGNNINENAVGGGKGAGSYRINSNQVYSQPGNGGSGGGAFWGTGVGVVTASSGKLTYYGNNGGSTGYYNECAGGGGGALEAGKNVSTNSAGGGGNGILWPINNIYYGGGGGGGAVYSRNTSGQGGNGGGGNGGSTANVVATSGESNTGGGGGGTTSTTGYIAGNGGSGVCIIAVPLFLQTYTNNTNSKLLTITNLEYNKYYIFTVYTQENKTYIIKGTTL